MIELGLPGLDSAGVCRSVRQRVPTLAVIAVTSGEGALESALALGVQADEYLAQPFSVREALVRIKVLLRRVGQIPGVAHAWEDRPLMLGALTVDPVRLFAHWNGQDAGLTVTEFLLLQSLVRRAGVVKTREELMQEVFPDHAASSDLIEMHIKRVRQRLERLEPRFDAIESVHGAGYRYRTGKATQ
jgi:two-component system response regulator ChvI